MFADAVGIDFESHMRATILSIGDEIVLGQGLDTNGAWLAERLLARGTVTDEHRTVGDDRDAIAGAIIALTARCDVLLMTGGLGPTRDDVTREALGDVLSPGRPLAVDEEALAVVRGWFARRHAVMPPSNERQALRPDTMTMIPNACGTAPGLSGRYRGCLVFALPGPPRELAAMFDRHVAPVLDEHGGGRPVVMETVHMYGAGESWAAERLGEVTARDRDPLVGITVTGGVVTARIRARTATGEVEPLADRIARVWAPYCFGRGTATLSRAVGESLRAAGQTLVTAESCTGGQLGAMIVDEPGSSDYYRGGWVTYADDLKTRFLDVEAGLIADHGAVSAPVAKAMAAAAVDRGEADWSLAITGVAGPDGPDGPDGSVGRGAGKPAGTVFIAVGRRGGEPTTRRFAFRGGRAEVRARAAESALQMLRFALIGAAADHPLIWEWRPSPGAAADQGDAS